MMNQSGNFPGTTAPQAQLARLKKRLANLSTQLAKVSAKAESSKDSQAQTLVARAKANTMTALSLSEAVDSIANQTALDLLTTPNNDVHVNVAVTAFEDVPDMNDLKPLATSVEPVVLQDNLPNAPASGPCGDLDQPKRFSCCSPSPDRWFDKKGATADDGDSSDTKPSTGANTCEEPSYVMMTMPVSISTSKERIDEFLKMGEALVAAAQTQMGQARESICHTSGEGTCSLF
ncbi:MAG: hypothetical protein JSS86_24110 [Cyanobacteria bacterium SZAS LIN-2]|nr:hypothetical protein [Cyanobacteria bacterium SZAS LIN-2]MBS2010020.1 hypothetical protein [Cyanobacteria bacterium SZAS TMP-1]